MTGVSFKIALVSTSVATAVVAGCERAGPMARAGIAVKPPASWRQVDPSAARAPGVVLAAWTGPDGSMLTLYRSLPAPGGSPKMIAQGLANRLENLPGLRVVVNKLEKVGDITAARVEVVAPGTGDAIAPSGTGQPIAPAGKTLLPTREVTVGFHRENASLFLTWATPESSYPTIAPDIQATLESVRFTASGKLSFYGY